MFNPATNLIIPLQITKLGLKSKIIPKTRDFNKVVDKYHSLFKADMLLLIHNFITNEVLAKYDTNLFGSSGDCI